MKTANIYMIGYLSVNVICHTLILPFYYMWYRYYKGINVSFIFSFAKHLFRQFNKVKNEHLIRQTLFYFKSKKQQFANRSTFKSAVAVNYSEIASQTSFTSVTALNTELFSYG